MSTQQNHQDRKILRDLAKHVAEISRDPANTKNIELWKRHNILEKVKPMVLVFPEGSWQELLPESALQCSDELLRRFEWHLRHLIYRWEHIRDDNVITSTIRVPLVYERTEWGLSIRPVPSPEERGAVAYEPVIREEKDLYRMKYPQVTIDEAKSEENLEMVSDILGDILNVKISRAVEVDTTFFDTVAMMRGLGQILVDMYDRPKWLHELLSFVMNGVLHSMSYLEETGNLELNNRDDSVGSGGVGYTDELPIGGVGGDGIQVSPHLNPPRPIPTPTHSPNGCPVDAPRGEEIGGGEKREFPCHKFTDLWGASAAQILTSISEDMYDEFCLQHYIPLLDKFGLNCYGCCEPITDKLHLIIKRIPRLRRVSISPWADLHIAREVLQDKYILSWKPNPSYLAQDKLDEEYLRSYVRRALEITRGSVVEIIMKDTHTVRNEPERFKKWLEIVYDEVDRFLEKD